jgi:hypothetical protein
VTVTFADRKAISLDQKLAAISAEFAHWKAVSAASQPLEKHHTQVRAITDHLSGLVAGTAGVLADAKTQGTVLEEGRNVESLLLGIRRIWEFFRAKLGQRLDDDLREYLQLADELAWECYKPVLDSVPAARREPPLVFLNGGLSPYALSRDQAFPAEAVPGEPLGGSTYDDVLDRLPIPIIGVPWYQTAHLPDLPVVAHETGHAVEHDFQWKAQIVARIGSALKGTPGAAHSAAWKAWASEMFADAWGCRAVGPAYAAALRDFLVQGKKDVGDEVSGDTHKYPTATLRILLCAELLKAEFPVDAERTRVDWLATYGPCQMKGYEADVPHVARALTLDHPGFVAVAFVKDDWEAAESAGGEVKKGMAPASATTAARLVAAARRLYDDDPVGFAAGDWPTLLKAHIKEIVRPGTRAGEPTRTQEELEDLTGRDLKGGADAFAAFRQWVGIAAKDKT